MLRVSPGWYVAADDLPGDKYARSRSLLLAKIRCQALTLPTNVVVSHHSAALLLGFPNVVAQDRVEVSNFRSRVFSRVGVKVYSRPRDRPTVMVRAGVRITSPQWTAVELLRTMDPMRGLAIADYALRLGCQRADLEMINANIALPRGRDRAAGILKIADSGAESPPESHLRFLVIRAGFSEVVTQQEIITRRGRYYVDLAIIEHKIVLEYDGESKYTDRQTLIREKQREDAIRAQGWEFVRITRRDLADPRLVVLELRAIAQSRGWKKDPARTSN